MASRADHLITIDYLIGECDFAPTRLGQYRKCAGEQSSDRNVGILIFRREIGVLSTKASLPAHCSPPATRMSQGTRSQVPNMGDDYWNHQFTTGGLLRRHLKRHTPIGQRWPSMEVMYDISAPSAASQSFSVTHMHVDMPLRNGPVQQDPATPLMCCQKPCAVELHSR